MYQSLHRRKTLTAASRELGRSGPDAEARLRTAVEFLAAALACDGQGFLLDAAHRALVLLGNPAIRIPLEEGLWSGVVQSATPLWVPDIPPGEAARLLQGWPQDPSGIRSLIALPLRTGAQVSGVVVLTRGASAAPFSTPDFRLAEDVVELAGEGAVQSANPAGAPYVEAKLCQALEGLGESWVLLDEHWRILGLNRSAAGLANRPPEGLAGRSFWDVFASAFRDETRQRVLEACELKSPATFEAALCLGRSYEVSVWPDAVGVWLLWRDRTDRHRAAERSACALREKDVLLKEIHHRVKNNLQVVASLLALHAESRHENPELTNLLEDCQRRIRSMALMHEHLYQSGEAALDLPGYFNRLVQMLQGAYDVSDRVTVQLHIQPIALAMEVAVPCALIVNELVTNAYEHAFPEGRSGLLRVMLTETSDGYARIHVSDTGIGARRERTNGGTLGLRLVEQLAEQLGGRFDIEIRHGTRCTVLFPLPRAKARGPA